VIISQKKIYIFVDYIFNILDMKKIIFSIFLLFIINYQTFSQIQIDEKPYSQFIKLKKYEATIDVSKPQQTKSSYPKNTIALVSDCDYSFFNNAVEENIDSGKIWHLTIASNDAYSLGFYFSNIYINKGVKIFIYTPDYSDVLGALTSNNNNDERILNTRQIFGDTAIIEMFVPNDVKQSDFYIKKIYYGLNKANFSKKSSDCNRIVYINDKYGENYQIEKHAVCYLSILNDNVVFSCTGSLINNSNYDGIPYLITAQHCIIDPEDAKTLVAYFNYEYIANDTILVDNIYSINGADLIAYSTQTYYSNQKNVYGLKIDNGYYNDHDVALLKLSSVPPKKYLPYYLGWSITADNIDTVSTIHHANSDVKQIALSNMPPYIDTYPKDDEIYLNNNHWHVDTWHKGYTSGGSSGAPLLNQNKQIIGVLSGGNSSCSNPYDDYFQNISKMWANHKYYKFQLVHWLANDLDIKQIDGYDPYGNFSDLPTAKLSGEWNSDSTLINLSWNIINPDFYIDNDIVGYKLYCNNKLEFEFDNNETKNYVFNNIIPNSTYIFYIENVYSENRTSKPSNKLILTNIPKIQTSISNQINIEPNIKIYPNPTQNNIYISSSETLGISEIIISTNIGQLIKKINVDIIQNQPININISDLKTGNYNITIKNKSTQTTQAIFIK
ncbi:MAG: trypsin-like serine protease, partial [Bacteroidales bacterium]|nr:trypsin-like serine protease [Bacteroidales bacterium]